jgi:hypothetical protein
MLKSSRSYFVTKGPFSPVWLCNPPAAQGLDVVSPLNFHFHANAAGSVRVWLVDFVLKMCDQAQCAYFTSPLSLSLPAHF